MPAKVPPPELEPQTKRARARLELPWGRLGVMVGLSAGALWASSSPGGVPARIEDFADWVRGGVESATADPQLRRAEEAIDAWHARNGRYPDRSEFDPDNPEYGLPVGLAIAFCSPRHVVVSGVTSRGTVSRLLVDGDKVSDVDGTPGCPVDPDAPDPWV